MKKLFVIPVMFIYLIAVSGLMIQLHYCGQDLESWNVYAENKGCIGDTCGDESKQEDGCCKDKVIASKVSNEQNSVSFFKLKLSTADAWLPALPSSILYDGAIGEAAAKTHTYNVNAPPGLWQQIPLYKLHSSLTYYG